VTSLTDAEKTDVRRFCGYPAFGSGATGVQTWRFQSAYGLLEYRMVNASEAELVVIRRYLASLSALELAIPRSSDSMDTDQASVWTRNRDEPRDRARLFDEWRRRLCGFFGIPPGAALSTGSLAVVV
jgi:hypothetical protein